MILSLLLLTQVTLERLAYATFFEFAALCVLGIWIVEEIRKLKDDLKKAGKL